MMCFFLFHPTWGLLILHILDSCFSTNLGSFSHSFFKYFPCLLSLLSWDFHHMYVGALDPASQMHEAQLVHFSSLFSLYPLDWMFSLDLSFGSLILSCAMSNLQLSPSHEIFTSVIVLLNSKIFIFETVSVS